MDENDINIQKYLICFDEIEKISLFGDEEDSILSDSDSEVIKVYQLLFILIITSWCQIYFVSDYNGST